VGKPKQLWALYREADDWKTTPANLLGVDDDYVAYCLNQAVNYFGKSVEEKMDKAASNAKNEKSANAARQRALKRILEPAGTGQFMDPAALFK
jgi:hypothetical protein